MNNEFYYAALKVQHISLQARYKAAIELSYENGMKLECLMLSAQLAAIEYEIEVVCNGIA